MIRPLRASDFHNKYTVTAIYHGNSRYLTKGETYEVAPTDDPKLVVVRLTDNPNLKYSNGGVRFIISTFRVREEDNMINFADLTPEDQERILAQARQMVDDENIKKDAKTVYNMKKKDLLEDNVNIICNEFHYKHNPEIKLTRQHYVSMVNYLYKVHKRVKGSIPAIIDNESWVIYQKIADDVKNMMIDAYNFGRA